MHSKKMATHVASKDCAIAINYRICPVVRTTWWVTHHLLCIFCTKFALGKLLTPYRWRPAPSRVLTCDCIHSSQLTRVFICTIIWNSEWVGNFPKSNDDRYRVTAPQVPHSWPSPSRQAELALPSKLARANMVGSQSASLHLPLGACYNAKRIAVVISVITCCEDKSQTFMHYGRSSGEHAPGQFFSLPQQLPITELETEGRPEAVR
mmetsp:Transcript_38226/g.67428  ORF Transcript_38226/g.67428 Transcript_38226/m.67428 type:complete len:207 (+) Transcript_38226:180-800(+)